MDADITHLISQHEDIAPSGRFRPVALRGVQWDLRHLEPFAFREELAAGLTVDVVVFFSCHCFTHDYRDDTRQSIPSEEVYLDGNDRRVLDMERWRLSQTYLPKFVQWIQSNHIRVLNNVQGNFATFQVVDRQGNTVTYAVFFTVKKDSVRRKRIILRVQSAYVLDQMTRRQKESGKVNLKVLLRAVYEGRKIKP